MENEYNRQDLIVASLSQQIANLTRQIAERDATITEQHMELESLRKEQIKEMDNAK